MNPPHRHDLVCAVGHAARAEDGLAPGGGSTTGDPTTTVKGAQ